jgi:uncharacterized protein YqjF (DUF2071 family)
MKLPVIEGVIRRRLLVNFRVDPDVIQRQLPSTFRPKLHAGSAIAGICLIRLEQIRPKNLPRFVGHSSENAAHRVAVLWENEAGETKEGVYISRRDTNSLINHFAGGRLFPGEHHYANFHVEDFDGRITLEMNSRDGAMAVELRGQVAGGLSTSSKFASLAVASSFFEPGALGYSATNDVRRLDGITLKTKTWRVEPLEVEHVCSSYFADEKRFPKGSVEFDCALLMRDIRHEWQSEPDLYV